MAIEQWRPNLRAAPTMPMGPYRRGDQPKYPDYAASNERVQAKWMQMGKVLGELLAKTNEEKAQSAVDGLNSVNPKTNENIKKATDNASDIGGTGNIEFDKLDENEKDIANGRIENLSLFLNVNREIITEYGKSDLLTEENLNHAITRRHSDAAGLLKEQIYGDGEFEVIYPDKSKQWEKYNDAKTMKRKSYKDKYDVRRGKGKKQGLAGMFGKNSNVEFQYTNEAGKEVRVTIGELQALKGSFKDTSEQKTTMYELISNTGKKIGDDVIPKAKRTKGYNMGMATDAQTAEILKRAELAAEQIIAQNGADFIYANVMRDEDSGRLRGALGDFLHDDENNIDQSKLEQVKEFITNEIIANSDIPVAPEKIETTPEKIDPPSQYPLTVSDQISMQFTDALSTNGIVNEGEFLQGGLVGLPIQTTDGKGKIVERYIIEKQDDGGVNLTLRYRGSGTIKGDKIYEEIENKDGSKTLKPVMVDIKDPETGKPTGQKKHATLEDQDEAFSLPPFDLTKEADVRKLYGLLGTDAEAREENYLNNEEWLRAKERFILDDDNLKLIIENDMGRIAGKGGTKHASWMDKISVSPYYRSRVIRSLQKIKTNKPPLSNVLTTKQQTFLDQLVELEKAYQKNRKK